MSSFSYERELIQENFRLFENILEMSDKLGARHYNLLQNRLNQTNRRLNREESYRRPNREDNYRRQLYPSLNLNHLIRPNVLRRPTLRPTSEPIVPILRPTSEPIVPILRPPRNFFPARPITRNVPFSFTNFVNTTLDTPINSDFPSYQQIQNATVSMLYSDVSDNSNDFCPIAQDSFIDTDEIIQICHCKHIFKKNSLLNWFNTSSKCPICRFDIRTDLSNSTTDDLNATDLNATDLNVSTSTADLNASNSTSGYNTSNSTSGYNTSHPYTFPPIFPPIFPITDLSLNSVTNIFSQNLNSALNNLETAVTDAIENTLQDLSNNNINAEVGLQMFFPTSN
jgi:hypothetical protein